MGSTIHRCFHPFCVLLALGAVGGAADGKTLVSYALYARAQETVERMTYSQQRCQDNINLFARVGVGYSGTVDYVFTAIGDSATPVSLRSLSRQFSNVQIEQGLQRLDTSYKMNYC